MRAPRAAPILAAQAALCVPVQCSCQGSRVTTRRRKRSGGGPQSTWSPMQRNPKTAVQRQPN